MVKSESLPPGSRAVRLTPVGTRRHRSVAAWDAPGERGRIYGGYLRLSTRDGDETEKKSDGQIDGQPQHVRKPRADAVRNRERVLEAAKAVFSAGGPDASLEAVARRAGVGIGTLYRHFPTREALFEAVYRREVQQLGELAEQLKNEADPVDALAPLAAIQRRVRRHQEGHVGGAGARRCTSRRNLPPIRSTT